MGLWLKKNLSVFLKNLYYILHSKSSMLQGRPVDCDLVSVSTSGKFPSSVSTSALTTKAIMIRYVIITAEVHSSIWYWKDIATARNKTRLMHLTRLRSLPNSKHTQSMLSLAYTSCHNQYFTSSSSYCYPPLKMMYLHLSLDN